MRSFNLNSAGSCNCAHSASSCDRAHSVAERSYPTSKVRGRSQEDPMPEGWWPRGITPRPRSGQWLRVPGCDGAGTAERSSPASKARGDGREEPQNIQGVVAARAQEGLEELSNVEGEEGWR